MNIDKKISILRYLSKPLCYCAFA